MGYSTIDQDEQHLKLLTIFYYILSAMMALFACFPILHLIVGITFLVAPDQMVPQPVPVQNPSSQNSPDQMPTGQQPQQPFHPGPPPLLFGLMFTIIPAIFILAGWTMAGLIFYGGRCLAKRKNYTFCFIAAGIACLFMPVGTILGVFSILVLVRPSVLAKFNRPPPERLKL